MTFSDLDIGAVFQVTDHPAIFIRPEKLWRKESPSRARAVDVGPGTQTLSARDLREASLQVVQAGSAATIRRSGDSLLLKGGDVQLDKLHNFTVLRCTPGDKFVEFVLTGGTFSTSETGAFTTDTAIHFTVQRGGSVLGRPTGSMIFAYRGRVYARATNLEVTGKKQVGGYRRFVKIDGVKRLVIAGLLTIEDDAALHDIIQDEFGPMSISPLTTRRRMP